MNIVFPGSLRIHASSAVETFFKGPNTEQSKGCSLCEQCGGKDSMITPLAFTYLRPWVPKWEAWLSRSRRTLLGRTCATKWCRKMTDRSATIQAEGCAAPQHPGGPSLIQWSLKWIRGNTNIGRTNVPTAPIAPQSVTVWPLSAEVMAPTCFVPFGATMVLGFCTVDMPLSSTFQMSFAWKLYSSNTSDSFVKNNFVCSLLKADALARLVHSGVRKARPGCLFMKLVNQSGSANSFSAHVDGMDMFIICAHWYAKDRISSGLNPKNMLAACLM